MNLPSSSSSSSQYSSLSAFDDQTAEAAAALLQIRGSPRTPHLPFIPDFPHSFISPSPVSTTPSYTFRQYSALTDSRYYVPVETNGVVSGSSSGPGPTLPLAHSPEFVPSSVPIISVPSPLRKRKRSLASESTPASSQPSSNKGKAVDGTPPSEGPSKGKGVLENDGIVRCICELQVDDGFTIQCESCQVWQHAACMRIHPKTVPQVYLCEQCNPRLVDGVRARRALLSRLQAKNAQKQAQEKKRQSRRTSSEAKQRKGTLSTSPQPQQTQQSASQRQSSTSLTSPSQPYALLQFDSQPHNPYPTTKDEILSPITPFVPIIDSTSSTPSTFYNPLPPRQPKDIPHILYPRIESLRLDRCQLCDGSNIECDHPLPPIITLHSTKVHSGEHNHWFQHVLSPNVILRPFVCDNKSERRGFEPQENAALNETSYMNVGIFALRDIKPGEEIVLGCEWDPRNVSKEPHRPNFFVPQDGAHACPVSTVLSNFSTCACGSPTEACVYAWCHRRLSDAIHQSNGVHEEPHNQKKATQQPRHPDENSQVNSTVSSVRAKKKPKTTKEGSARKTSAASTRKRRGVTGGKKGAASKPEVKDMDIDQDVDIDAKSDDVNVAPSMESPTNALATLSLRGTPENKEQKQRPSHESESVVDSASKPSDTKELPTSEDNFSSAVTTAKGSRSRASSVTNPLLEPPASYSPRSSAIKPISAVVLSPLLPSSAVNAHPAVHMISSVTVESADIPVVSLPTAMKEPSSITEETTKKLPIKRLSLADWKISKDREKRALREAQTQEKVVKEQDTEGTRANDTAERSAEVGRRDSPDITLNPSSRISSVDIDDKPTTADASFSDKPDMTALPISTGLMESGMMKLKVEVSDDCNAEARPFTSPQVPSCSLHADSSSDPRHTPPCTPSLAIDDRHSPFETAFEEGEIKQSSPPSKDQVPLTPRPPSCPPSQPPQISRRSRSASPSHSPPTRPRSYHHQLHQRPPPPPPRSLSPSGTYSRSASGGPPRGFSSRPVPSAPRALRGGIPPRHPSSFSSSYRPNNYRDYDRHRGSAYPYSSNSRFHDSSSQSDSRRPWVDPSWKR